LNKPPSQLRVPSAVACTASIWYVIAHMMLPVCRRRRKRRRRRRRRR